MRPRLLDLFCGAGGSAVGYHRAGFDVVGVDIVPQPNYPFEFVQADALEFLATAISFARKQFDAEPLTAFDAIHASPPCQAYSGRTPEPEKHPKLIGPTRELLEQTGLPYVIENVEGARDELLSPVTLCGSAFKLRVRRHRLFESNFSLTGTGCFHEWQDENPCFVIYDHKRWFWTGVAPVYGSGGRKAKEYWPSAMGCGETWDDCWMTPDELREAIPPAFTEHIGHQLMSVIHSRCEDGTNSEKASAL